MELTLRRSPRKFQKVKSTGNKDQELTFKPLGTKSQKVNSIWSTIALDQTSVSDEDRSGVASFLVSFMQLDLWQNVQKHGKDNIFVMLSVVDTYIPNSLYVIKNFYKDVNEIMTGESKRRKRTVDEMHEMRPGDAFRDLLSQLNRPNSSRQPDYSLNDTIEGERVVNLYVLTGYIRARYERLHYHVTRTNDVSVQSLLKATWWKTNVLTPARIVYMHERAMHKNLESAYPINDQQATTLLAEWISATAAAAIASQQTPPNKKPRLVPQPPMKPVQRLQQIIQEMTSLSPNTQLQLLTQMESLIQTTKRSLEAPVTVLVPIRRKQLSFAPKLTQELTLAPNPSEASKVNSQESTLINPPKVNSPELTLPPLEPLHPKVNSAPLLRRSPRKLCQSKCGASTSLMSVPTLTPPAEPKAGI